MQPFLYDEHTERHQSHHLDCVPDSVCGADLGFQEPSSNGNRHVVCHLVDERVFPRKEEAADLSAASH